MSGENLGVEEVEAQDGVVIGGVATMTVGIGETDIHHHQAEGMRCRHPTSE